MYYVHYEKDTMNILGFYRKGLHDPIPKPCIVLDEQAWQTALAETHNKVSADLGSTFASFPSEEDPEKQAYLQWKAEREQMVANIVVEIDGYLFDGDEISQGRMARAAALSETPEETVRWILADNSVANVTADQLRRAARAAGREQEAIWVRQKI